MPYNPTGTYRPLFGNLADQKAVGLAAKYQEKKERLAPTPAPVAPPAVNPLTSDSDDGLASLGYASLLRAGGNIADAGRDASNYLFNTEFDSSGEVGYSNPDIAAQAAGVTPEYKRKFEEDQQAVMNAVVEEDYLGALGAAGNVALRTAVDSFATIPEVAAGALLTAFTGVGGAPILAKKGKDILDTGEKIKKSYDKAKKLKEANRLGKVLQAPANLARATATAAGRASILTADLAQQQVSEYRTKYGEDPSAERRTAMTLGVLATTIWEPAIIANLFIPKFKKELIEEGQTLVKGLVKGQNLKSIGVRIGNGLEKIAKAGAAEAGQEYIQTWQEILAVDITPEQADDLWGAVRSKLSKKTLQDKALTGGILGGMAGGVTRGAISAPAVAVGTAVDVTKATAKGTAKVALGAADIASKASQKAANKAGMALLSEEEREVVRNDYANRKTVFDQKIKVFEDGIQAVAAAKTAEDITSNKVLSKAAKEAQEELGLTTDELNNPKNLSKFKDKLTRNYKAAQSVLDVELKASTVGQVGAAAAGNIKKGVVKAFTDVVESEQVAKVVKSVEKYGDVAVQSVKELRSGTALGVVELGIDGTIESSKKAFQKAKKLNLADLQRTAAAVDKKNPTLAKKLNRLAARKRLFLKKVGQRNDDLVTKKNLSPVVKDMAAKGTFDAKNATGAASAIKSTLASKIADKKTLATVKKAIEVYKQSEAYINQEAGSIDETSMSVLEGRLDTATSRLNRELTGENFEETVDNVAEAVGDKVKKGKSKVKATLKKRRKDKIKNREARVEEGKGNQSIVDKAARKAKDIFKAAGKVVEDTDDKVDEKIKAATREKKVLDKGSLMQKLNAIAPDLGDPDTAAGIAEHVDAIAKTIRKEGYSTAEDLNDLVEQFPFLGQDPTFYVKLQTSLDIKPKTDPDTDVVMSKEDRLNSEEDVLIADNKLVSLFKTITGCKA